MTQKVLMQLASKAKTDQKKYIAVIQEMGI